MDLRKLRDKASEAFTKGRFAKAAELYQEYCEKDPRDIQAKLRMGDAWAKAGERPKAIFAYKAAAEAFAKEGFLPRAIAASKLILELDPGHQGIQQMLADLYARKGSAGPKKPAAPAPAPAAPSRHAPIELPDEEPAPEVSAAPIDTPEPAPPEPAKVYELELPADEPALPPELELHEAPQPPPAPPEPHADEPLAAAAPQPNGPPGLKPKAPAVELEAVEEPIPATELLKKPAPPPAPRNVLAAEPPSNEVSAPPSRIWIPGAESAVAAPASAPKAFADNGAAWARPTNSDLERAISRFDELSLDDAPPEAGAPEAPPARLPSFTELELEGDSLLHAVEVAAQAGKHQRGEAPAQDGEEEEVFTLTAEVEAGPRTADELPKIPLFSDLPPDAFMELFDRCPLRRYGPNERIIAQGSVGDAFYVVCEGEVRVVRDEADGPRELAVLKDGAFFGEMALLSGAPRSASVDSASDDTQLLEISAPVLAQLSLRFPSVAQALKRFCRQRMLSNVMNSSPLFRPFSKSDRGALVERFRARDVNKGAVVIQEGKGTDGMYVVLSGEVQVTRDGQRLADLHEGDLFGEMSLLKKTPATATVTATRRTSLLRLPREDFDALVLSHPQILMLVSDLTEDRQRQTDAVLSGSAEIGEEGLMLV